MWISEKPENPDHSPKGKPQIDFASNLVSSILVNAITGNGLSLRNEAVEKALADELDKQPDDDNGDWIIRVAYKVMNYANELFLGGDTQGAREVCSLFISKAMIELMKEWSK